MAAFDVMAQVEAQALAVAGQQAFGEELGVAVTWMLASTPQGAQVVFTVMVSMRAPLLGQGPLFSAGQILSPNPSQEQVEATVAECLRQLRGLSSQMLAKGNGKP